MNKHVIAVAFSLAAFSGTAMAQSGFYGGLELGGAFLSDQTGNLASTIVTYVGGSASASQSKTVGMFRAFGGYNFNSQLALELGFLRTGNASLDVSGTAGNGISYAVGGSAHVQGIDVSAIFHPIASGQGKGLLLRAGLSHYSYSYDYSVSGNSLTIGGSASDSGMGENFGVGYDFKMGPGKLRAEFVHAMNIAGDSGNNANTLQVGYYWQ